MKIFFNNFGVKPPYAIDQLISSTGRGVVETKKDGKWQNWWIRCSFGWMAIISFPYLSVLVVKEIKL